MYESTNEKSAQGNRNNTITISTACENGHFTFAYAQVEQEVEKDIAELESDTQSDTNLGRQAFCVGLRLLMALLPNGGW